MPLPVTGLVVDLLGFLTGTALYVMLIAMVWRERAGEHQSLWTRRGRLPLLTGLCGLVWNVGALMSFGSLAHGSGRSGSLVLALSFSALGFLPAVVVHALLEGRETVAGRGVTRAATAAAYGLSTTAAVMQVLAVMQARPVPSPPALWLLTGGFAVLSALLLLVTRQQPIGRRGVWVAALSLFAVSALHFGRHVGNESWGTELLGHHASLLLALAILHQDYRFALADLFLKNAIAVLLLMGVSLATLSGAVVPLLRWQDADGAWDPRAIVGFLALWMATALLFPVMRRLAARVVDRVVLRRPDYDATVTRLGEALGPADSEERVAVLVGESIRAALGATDWRTTADPIGDADRRLVLSGADLKAQLAKSASALVRLRTVEPPHTALVIGPLAAGRRLLSDDRQFLETTARLAARRIDSLRVAHERLTRNVREQQMQRLASEAELRALRSQLNPHFLFNALTTIGYLIQHAPERALETLLRLTSVLRAVLRRSTDEFSTLGDEIDLVTSYLDIERARFEERLRVEIDVPRTARALRIPTLLLQPLVENAVRHGIGPRSTGGMVRVRARESGSFVRLEITDTGLGFNPCDATRGLGVGLRSVGERLRVHFGETATLDIQSTMGQGTTITVVLPAERRRRGGPTASIPEEQRQVV